jgi:hypothetical protein
MIFQWDPEVPLVVGDDIELPQLALIKNYTADCTQVLLSIKQSTQVTRLSFFAGLFNG